MNRQEIRDKLRAAILPFVPDPTRLESAEEATLLREELNISSMHMIDVVIALEETFDIEIQADEVDHLSCIGQVLDLIERKKAGL